MLPKFRCLPFFERSHSRWYNIRPSRFFDFVPYFAARSFAPVGRFSVFGLGLGIKVTTGVGAGDG